MKKARTMAMLAGIAVTGSAFAVDVSDDIAGDVVWTNDNTYNLLNQIYVLPGASLTIQAGTIVASTPTTDGSGSLAVTRGGQVFINGTRDNPVIMTSLNDVATWTDGDPKTGVWREAANEWGNLTIMGRAYISNSFVDGNEPFCDAGNRSPMEGLVASEPGDPNVLYGGGDDDDDSGSINFLSIRYGGRVVGLANELNGLSLGGIGRETEIKNVEIMNNVDDGVEIWGGTVCPMYISIWNIGDDCFDIDQGWRGKAMFGLLVQGYSLDAAQGSGVGDNGFETDGAEDSDAQPVTTAVINNFTFIGQPAEGAGDGATAWRDNARVQYHNCIIMDCGERVVRFDNVDGDGSAGYGAGGTLTWPQTWNRNYTETSTVNPCPDPASIYTAQTSGKLAEFKNTVFFRNNRPDAYTEAEARGVFDDPTNVIVDEMPITLLTRAAPVLKGGTVQQRVTKLNPSAANAAASSADGGSSCSLGYSGGFPANLNWLTGWTAADAYGFNVDTPCSPDIDRSGDVGFTDLLATLSTWGPCPGAPADLDFSGDVGFTDLLDVLATWGPCP